MSISYWDIYLWQSGDTYTNDGTVPRPNQDIETTIISTQSKVRLTNGSNAFISPETKRVKEMFSIFWAETTSALRTKIITYMENGDKVKIITHTAEEFIGRFVEMKRVWFTGMSPDSYDINVSFEQTE